MTGIKPKELRALANTLGLDGVVTRKDVDKLIDATMADGTLDADEKKELKNILKNLGDKMESEDVRNRLAGFIGDRMPPAIRELAYQLERDDGVIDAADAQKLIDLVEQNGPANKTEKASLQSVLLGSLLSTSARLKMLDAISDGPGRVLDPTGSRRQVFLSPTGHLVLNPDDSEPKDAMELGSAMFRFGEVIDDTLDNPIKALGLSLDQATSLFQNIQNAKPTGLTQLSEKQSAQLRGSSATILLSLMETLATDGDAGKLKEEILDTYLGLLDKEKNPIVRDSMMWNLYFIADGLPNALKVKSLEVVDALAPLSPNYAKMHQDGRDNLHILHAVDKDEEFFVGTKRLLEKNGFEMKGEETDEPLLFQKTIRRPDGSDMLVHFNLIVGQEHTFDGVGHKKFGIASWDGHSKFGNTVRIGIKNRPDIEGAPLIFPGLCNGKDTFGLIREEFPASQVITTFTSSYFWAPTMMVDGKKQKVMTDSENFRALMVLIDATAKEQNWESINERIDKEAIKSRYNHVMLGGTNYFSPIHILLRRRLLDSDHDGQADIFDKHVNVDTFQVAEDTKWEFRATKPAHPVDKLDGTRTHLASLSLATSCCYNTVTMKNYKKNSIVGDGYFAAQSDDDPMVRFIPDENNGEKFFRVQVNSDYAHMSEEALRAVIHYEFMMMIPEAKKLGKLDQRLMALTFAAFAILKDTKDDERDTQIWRRLVAKFGLPLDTPFAPIEELLDSAPPDYSGNRDCIRGLRSAYSEEILAALSA